MCTQVLKKSATNREFQMIKVAILGSGNIGIDLCERLSRDPDFEVVALVGRRSDSPGLQRFEGRIPHTFGGGLKDLLPEIGQIDGVFDATSASAHKMHWETLSKYGKWMVDLTPSRVGSPMVPALIGWSEHMKLGGSARASNFSMITCGGQSAAPLLASIAAGAEGIKEVEISSSIAADSAGPATRQNVDEYIGSTEGLGSLLTGCRAVKAILVLNPVQPPVMMRTTVTVAAEFIDFDLVRDTCQKIVNNVRVSVPGYDVVVAPFSQSRETAVITARVTGAGYYLPAYAGNLDIINAAAVETARLHATAHGHGSGGRSD